MKNKIFKEILQILIFLICIYIYVKFNFDLIFSAAENIKESEYKRNHYDHSWKNHYYKTLISAELLIIGCVITMIVIVYKF